MPNDPIAGGGPTGLASGRCKLAGLDRPLANASAASPGAEPAASEELRTDFAPPFRALLSPAAPAALVNPAVLPEAAPPATPDPPQASNADLPAVPGYEILTELGPGGM